MEHRHSVAKIISLSHSLLVLECRPSVCPNSSNPEVADEVVSEIHESPAGYRR